MLFHLKEKQFQKKSFQFHSKCNICSTHHLLETSEIDLRLFSTSFSFHTFNASGCVRILLMNDILMSRTKGVSSYKEFQFFFLRRSSTNVLQFLLIPFLFFSFSQKGHNEAARTQLGRRLLENVEGGKKNVTNSIVLHLKRNRSHANKIKESFSTFYCLFDGEHKLKLYL